MGEVLPTEISTWIGLRETKQRSLLLGWAQLRNLEPATGTLCGQRTYILVLSWAIFSLGPRSHP